MNEDNDSLNNIVMNALTGLHANIMVFILCDGNSKKIRAHAECCRLFDLFKAFV